MYSGAAIPLKRERMDEFDDDDDELDEDVCSRTLIVSNGSAIVVLFNMLAIVVLLYALKLSCE